MNKEYTEKEANFLKAVKSCINVIGHDFYSLPTGKILDDVTNLLQIDIDIDKLLNNGHGTDSTLRYALASCYNDIDTSKHIISRTLLNKHNYDGLKTLKVTDESVRDSVYKKLIKTPMITYTYFGIYISHSKHYQELNNEIGTELVPLSLQQLACMNVFC